MSDRSSRHTKTYVSSAETRRGVHGAPVANVRAFFEVVEKSNLIAPEMLAETRELFKGHETGPAEPVARHLQERGLLTRWQCRQLLDGRSVFFLGRYKLRYRIGSGGMGTVFQAEHQMMDRVVALKVIRPKLLRDPHTLTRFLREIKAVASLVHPNIVTAYDADCVGDTYFLVMELIDGKDLDSWVRAQGPLPMRWACDFCRQAALGLQHAHERGLVHRDIKPKNLLAVVERGEKPPTVKILDFGLARLVSDKQESAEAVDKTVIGSFGYMAPEHVREPAKSDIRGDIFSLGCTLFFLLTGSPPFVGDTDEEVLDKLLHGQAPLLRTMLPSAPPALEQIVAKMLAPNPRDRFQSPQEVAQALASFSAITLKSFAGANAPVPLSSLSPTLLPPAAYAGLESEIAGDLMFGEFADRLTHAPQSLNTGGVSTLLAADLGPATGTIPLRETRAGWSHHTVPGLTPKKASQWPIVAMVAGAAIAVAMLIGLWKLESSLTKEEQPATPQSIEDPAANR